MKLDGCISGVCRKRFFNLVVVETEVKMELLLEKKLCVFQSRPVLPPLLWFSPSVTFSS